MRTNIFIDQDTRDAIQEMPRKMSSSKLFRWLMKLMVSDSKEWKRAIREEGEIKQVQDFVRPKLRMALGLPDDERDFKK